MPLITTLVILAILFRNGLPWLGRISRVVDGDSLELGSGMRITRIRVAGVDAPEWRQPYGRIARSALVELVEGRLVLFLPLGRDRYDRRVCRVLVGWRDVACVMAYRGHAWPLRLLPWLIAIPARLLKRGLWASPDAVEPRIWRIAEQKGMRPARR